MSVTGHHYHSTRVRGLAPWSPKASTLEVVEQVNQVIAEYRRYLPMTARQIFYRLVGTVDYDKTEKAYKRLLEYLNRGRRAGLINWHAIRDDGFTSRGGGGYDNAQQWIDATVDDAERYRRDRQEGQDTYIEVWVEAAGMVPQVARFVSDRSIPVYSSGGFNSVTAKHTTASRISRRDRPTTVLHIGDYDPSGVAIIDSLADDINMFLEDMWADPADFVRVAVTPEQTERLGLPGAPAKASDKRGGFDDLAVQAEAIAPGDLQSELLDVVANYWDDSVLNRLVETERTEREQLMEAVRSIEIQ